MMGVESQRVQAKWAALAADPSALRKLSEEEVRALGMSLRDAYFALSSRDRSQGGDQTFRSLVNAIDFPATTEIEGLSLHFHPTARFKLVRFVDEDRIPSGVRLLFAHPVQDLPQLCAVFVDPEELSYRTFENIIPLDRYFSHGELSCSLESSTQIGKKGSGYSFRLAAPEAVQRRLLGLDGLDLYVPPLNASSRGGERYIFHSARLAEALTAALKSALPAKVLKGFSHVNPVFRANRFEPGDRKFHRHTDTPYYDAARKQVSRYTLLLYLTSGCGNPALQIGEDVAFSQIDAMTCVVFDQSLSHEGSAYADGRKVFLRSELVFTDPNVVHDDKIAELFAKACYLTGESVFSAELGKYADDCYNRVARAHFAGLSEEERAAPTPYVHKEFRGVHFAASGYDFWFAKGHLSVKECAAIALLDSFNCQIGGTTFHKLCSTEVLPPRVQEEEWLPALLTMWNKTPPAEPALGTFDKRALFPPAEDNRSSCCPFHSVVYFDATRCEDIVEYFERAQAFAKRRVFPAPIFLLGQEVFLDPEQFVVEAGRIQVLSEQTIAPVNFAACWNFGGSPSNYVDVDRTVAVLQPLVPPILFVETADCYRLMFDFFRNSWMVKPLEYSVPIPFVSDVDPGEAEERGKTPWLTAAKKANVKRGQKGGKGPWWGESTSGVMAELYPKDGKPPPKE